MASGLRTLLTAFKQIQFIEINSIWVSRADGNVIIRGLPYARNRGLRGKLENKRNEVCQILEMDADDQRPAEVQALAQISPRQILRVRVLNKTNALFPKYQYGGDSRHRFGKTESEREDQAPLTCRWKFPIEYKDSRFRKYDKPDPSALVRLTEHEADERFRVPDKEIMVNFRGRTHRGGSYKPQIVDLDGLRVPTTRNDRQFTFADAFCGAGGASRGAVMAGLKVSLPHLWAFSRLKQKKEKLISGYSNSLAACIWCGSLACLLRNMAT